MRRLDQEELREDLTAFLERGDGLRQTELDGIEERYRDASRIDCTIGQFQTFDEHTMRDMGYLLLEIKRLKGLPLSLELPKEWGTCELCEGTERELFTCYDCDRAICMECVADVENWLCRKCKPVAQEEKDDDG